MMLKQGQQQNRLFLVILSGSSGEEGVLCTEALEGLQEVVDLEQSDDTTVPDVFSQEARAFNTVLIYIVAMAVLRNFGKPRRLSRVQSSSGVRHAVTANWYVSAPLERVCTIVERDARRFITCVMQAIASIAASRIAICRFGKSARQGDC